MNTKLLLVVTAIFELATGVALLIIPSQTAELLLGAGLGSPEAMMVARVSGAALVSIGLTCWLERNCGRTRSGLVGGLLAYNVLVAILLTYAAVVQSMHGIGLWPAIGLHSGLSIWCIGCMNRTVT